VSPGRPASCSSHRPLTERWRASGEEPRKVRGHPSLPTEHGWHPNRSLQYPVPMADAAQSQPVAPRLASVREQLSLLSDYL